MIRLDDGTDLVVVDDDGAKLDINANNRCCEHAEDLHQDLVQITKLSNRCIEKLEKNHLRR